jgi:flagellar biosynthetic protein FliR
MTTMEAWAITWALATVRFAPLFMLSAMTPFAWVPGQVRAVLVMALGGILVAGLAQPVVTGQLAAAAAGELLQGACIGLAVMLPMAALANAAKLLDVQAGLASATLFNPAVQQADSLFGTFFSLAGTQVFFAMGFDLLVLRALVASGHLVPVGSSLHMPDLGSLLGLFGAQFMLGLMVVIPVVLGLFAVDLGVAYASRSMPQANIYFLALPVKTGVAFLLLAVTVQTTPALVGRLFSDALARVGGLS